MRSSRSGEDGQVRSPNKVHKNHMRFTRFKCFKEAHVEGENKRKACETRIQAAAHSVLNPDTSPLS